MKKPKFQEKDEHSGGRQAAAPGRPGTHVPSPIQYQENPEDAQVFPMQEPRIHVSPEGT